MKTFIHCKVHGALSDAVNSKHILASDFWVDSFEFDAPDLDAAYDYVDQCEKHGEEKAIEELKNLGFDEFALGDAGASYRAHLYQDVGNGVEVKL